jgi:hypothetical protein
MPEGGVPPSARRRIPSFSFAFRYGWFGARSRHAAQRSVQRSRESSVRGATALPHHEQENGVIALSASASARLGCVDRRSCRRLVLVPVGVNLDVWRPLCWDRFGREDGVHWALGLTCAAVNALIRINEQLAIAPHFKVDAVNRTNGDARLIKDINTWFRNHICHRSALLLNGPF